jgi:hypothetical protein
LYGRTRRVYEEDDLWKPGPKPKWNELGDKTGRFQSRPPVELDGRPARLTMREYLALASIETAIWEYNHSWVSYGGHRSDEGAPDVFPGPGLWEFVKELGYEPASVDPRFWADFEDARDGLTDRERFVIDLRLGLRDGTEYRQQEIADSMGVRQPAVAQAESRARRRLKDQLRRYRRAGEDDFAQAA